MELYDLPGCSRDSNYFDFKVTSVSSQTVCFCCLASNTPVINAITCIHTEFLQPYFTELNNQKLSICYTCHYMLKKLDMFQRQVRESLNLLNEYQQSQDQTLNRPKLVNNLITTSIIVTSNITAGTTQSKGIKTERRSLKGEDKPEMKAKEDSDNEKIEVETNLLQPVPVVIKRRPGRPRKKRLGRPPSNPLKLQPKHKKDPEPTTIKETPIIQDDLLIEIPTKTKRKSSTKSMKTKISVQNKQTQDMITFKPPKTTKNENINTDTKELKPSTYWLAKELSKLRKEPKTVRKPAISMRIKHVKLFSMTETFHEMLETKYDGKIKIIYLNQDEVMAEREIEKQKENYLKKPYKCELCIQGFTDENLYKRHKTKSHPKNRVSYEVHCDVCDTAIKTKKGLRRHLKSHVLRYICVECGKTSKFLELLERHYKVTHTLRKKCKDCHKSFPSKRDLSMHKREEHKINCIYCKKVFIKWNDIYLHYRKTHRDEYPMKCDTCTEAFKTRAELDKHKEMSHNITKNVTRKVRNGMKSQYIKPKDIIEIESENEDTKTHKKVLKQEKSNRKVINIKNNEPNLLLDNRNEQEIIDLDNSIEIVNEETNQEVVDENFMNVIKIESVHHSVRMDNGEENEIVINYLGNNLEYNALDGKEDQTCIIGL